MHATSSAGAGLLTALCLLACSDNESGSPLRGRPLVELRIDEHARIDGVKEDLVPISVTAFATGLVIGRDGGIAVAQPQDGIVRFFSADGEALGAFGRKGDGPGEFRSVRSMGWVHDTLWVWDVGLRRTTLIGPTRRFLRQLIAKRSPPGELPSVADPEGYQIMPAPLALAADGSSLRSGAKDGNGLLVRVDSAATPLKIVARTSTSAEIDRKQVRAGGEVMAADMFPNGPFTDVSGGGELVVIVRAHLDGPMASNLDVTVLRADGDTTYSRTYPYDAAPIPSRVRDSALAALGAAIAQAPAEVRAAARNAYMPPVYPPVAGVLIGDDGEVWIQLRDTDVGRRYVVLDEKGDPVGVLTLKPNERVAAVAGNSVWVLEANADDIQSVVAYRLRRP